MMRVSILAWIFFDTFSVERARVVCIRNALDFFFKFGRLRFLFALFIIYLARGDAFSEAVAVVSYG
jgi:hypothetical protein